MDIRVRVFEILFMLITKCASFLNWMYFQYRIHLGIDILETWERRFFGILLFILYTSIQLPCKAEAR